MQKKYIVRLVDEERVELQGVVARLRGGSQKARRARMLLQADADGPAWTDARIAEAFGCRRQTVESLRQRFVESGFREALDGKRRAEPPTEKLLDGKQEAQLIALRLGPPPRGYAQWTLRLLARKVAPKLGASVQPARVASSSHKRREAMQEVVSKASG